MIDKKRDVFSGMNEVQRVTVASLQFERFGQKYKYTTRTGGLNNIGNSGLVSK
jgi:hypothetical protein